MSFQRSGKVSYKAKKHKQKKKKKIMSRWVGEGSWQIWLWPSLPRGRGMCDSNKLQTSWGWCGEPLPDTQNVTDELKVRLVDFKKKSVILFLQIGDQILYKLVVKSRRGHSDSRRQQHHEGGGGDDGGGFHQDGDNPLTLGPGCARQIMRTNVDTWHWPQCFPINTLQLTFCQVWRCVADSLCLSHPVS